MSDWGPHEKCETCGSYGWRNRHRCLPKWRVRLPDYDDEWFTVHAVDEQDAAEQAAKKSDEGGHSFIAAGGIEVVVEVTNQDGEVKHFAVQGEMLPSYSASEVLS